MQRPRLRHLLLAALTALAVPGSAAAASWQPPFTLAGGAAAPASTPGRPVLDLGAGGAGIVAWPTSAPARAHALVAARREADTPFAGASAVSGGLGDPFAAAAGPSGARALVARKLGSKGTTIGLAIRVWRGRAARPVGFSTSGSPVAVRAGFTTGGLLVVSWYDRSTHAIRLVAGLPDGTYTKPIVVAAFSRAREGADYGLAIGRGAAVVWLSNGARQALLISSAISPSGTVSSFTVLGPVPRSTNGIVAAGTAAGTGLLVAWRSGSGSSASVVVFDVAGQRRISLPAGGSIAHGPYLVQTRPGRGVIAWTVDGGARIRSARIAAGGSSARTAISALAAGGRIDDAVLRANAKGRAVLAWREPGANGSVRAAVGQGALRRAHLLASGAIAGIDDAIAPDGTVGVIWTGVEAGSPPAVRLAYDATAGPAVTPPTAGGASGGPTLHPVPPIRIPPLP